MELPIEYCPVRTRRWVPPSAASERCYLYDFTRDHGGTLLHDRYTSYERDVTYGGFTWISADVAHGAIRQGLAWTADRVDLSGQGLGNPLVTLAALQRGARPMHHHGGRRIAHGRGFWVVILAVGEGRQSPAQRVRPTGQMSPGGRLSISRRPASRWGAFLQPQLVLPGMRDRRVRHGCTRP